MGSNGTEYVPQMLLFLIIFWLLGVGISVIVTLKMKETVNSINPEYSKFFLPMSMLFSLGIVSLIGFYKSVGSTLLVDGVIVSIFSMLLITSLFIGLMTLLNLRAFSTKHYN